MTLGKISVNMTRPDYISLNLPKKRDRRMNSDLNNLNVDIMKVHTDTQNHAETFSKEDSVRYYCYKHEKLIYNEY